MLMGYKQPSFKKKRADLKITHGLDFNASNIISSMDSNDGNLPQLQDKSIDEIKDVDLSKAELVSDRPMNNMNMSVIEKRHHIKNLKTNVLSTYKLTSKQTPKNSRKKLRLSELKSQDGLRVPSFNP
jgi:hypothetical protein